MVIIRSFLFLDKITQTLALISFIAIVINMQDSEGSHFGELNA